MRRRLGAFLIVFLGGTASGAGLILMVTGNVGIAPPSSKSPPTSPVLCEPHGIDSKQSKDGDLSEQSSGSKIVAPSLDHSSGALNDSFARGEPISAPDESDEQIERRREIVEWKVSAIEKFVPLTDEQKKSLADKFQQEQEAREAGQKAHTPPLEEILGEEGANYYRGQVRAAFDRVQNEEIQKEALWVSRQLQLTSEQESAVSQLFSRIEQRIDEEFRSGQSSVAASSHDRVKILVAENKRRAELRAEELKRLLPSDRYEAYLRSAAESAASDMEVFHDSGG